MAQDIFPVKKFVLSKCLYCGNDMFAVKAWRTPSMTRPCSLFRMLNCEAHRCHQVCHRGPCQPCPRSPSLVKTCPCGQTPLTKLLELGYSERRSCSDPIPSCGKTCNKPLPCGSNGTLTALKFHFRFRF